jgi:hypothetical protein
MYVHLTSDKLVSKNGACSFRTHICPELNFGDTEYEVALVSWHYYGQKFSSHLPVEHERTVELQKCINKQETLVWQWDSGDSSELYVEINGTRAQLASSDYTWDGFQEGILNLFKSVCLQLKLRTRVVLKYDGIQFYDLPAGANIKFSKKLADMLRLNFSTMSSAGFTIPKDMDNVNLHLNLNYPVTTAKVIHDVIVFPPECVVRSSSQNFKLAAGSWSLSNFEKLIQTKFNVDSFTFSHKFMVTGRIVGGYEYRMRIKASHNIGFSNGKQLYFNRVLQETLRIRCDDPRNPDELNRDLRKSADNIEQVNFLKYEHFYMDIPWLMVQEPVKKVIIKQSMFSNTANMLEVLTNVIGSNTDGEKIFKFYFHDETNNIIAIEHVETLNGVRWQLRLSEAI